MVRPTGKRVLRRIRPVTLSVTQPKHGTGRNDPYPRMSVHLPLLDQVLREQQDLRAALRFSAAHAGLEQDEVRTYRELVPLSAPRAGEQYAFHVDLDSCTGCKACVVGCNKLNGLDPGEGWRSVGTIVGGAGRGAPVVQTVTAACHHCVDPACAKGCPVNAYEKDAVTGIVRHLDDQCIGCQYCTLTCPYEVPQYNARLGIVRKCDMCSGRLAEGEAPACVQSCPNGAISIRVVAQAQALADAQVDAFLPGAPSPGHTVPTTTYASKRPLPRDALPVDFYAVRPAAHHLPLVVMLVLTQLSAGAYVVDGLLRTLRPEAQDPALHQAHSLTALALALIALGAATLHLGRPLYAFRAVLALRTSWMSREIVAFGAFAQLAILDAALSVAPGWWEHSGIPAALGVPVGTLARAVAAGAALTGLLGVLCSVMIYVVTGKAFWSAGSTGLKFCGTTAVLGLATAATVSTLRGAPWSASLAAATGLVLTGKVLAEAGILTHLTDKQQGPLKRTALLIIGELRRVALGRVALGALGAAVLLLAARGPRSGAAMAAAVLGLGLLTVAELLERSLFFTALSAPRMPGGLR